MRGKKRVSESERQQGVERGEERVSESESQREEQRVSRATLYVN